MTRPSLTWAPLRRRRTTTRSASATRPTATRSGSATSTATSSTQPVPYPAMTDISARLLLPGHLRLAGHCLRRGQRPARHGPGGPLHRRSRSARRPATPWPSAASSSTPTTPARRTRAPRRPAAARCRARRCSSGTPDPRAAYYMVYVSERRQLHQPARAQQRHPGDDQHDVRPGTGQRRLHTYPDNQAGQSYYWHIRPCRTALNCGPDPVSRTDMAQGTFIKRSPQVTGLTSSSPAGTEITFTLDRLLVDTNQEQPWAQTGEIAQPVGQAVPHRGRRRHLLRRQRWSTAPLVDQATYTASKALPRGDALLAGPGHRLRRQRPHVVGRPSRPHQAEPAGRADLARQQRDGRRHDAVPLDTPGLREVLRHRDLRQRRHHLLGRQQGSYASATGVRNAAYVPTDTLPGLGAAYRVARASRPTPTATRARGRRRAGSSSAPAPSTCCPRPPAGVDGPQRCRSLQWQPGRGAATYTVTAVPPPVGRRRHCAHRRDARTPRRPT